MSELSKFLSQCRELIFDGNDHDIIGFNKKELLRLVECVEVLAFAVDRNHHPHVEKFCKERCKEALEKVEEILK